MEQQRQGAEEFGPAAKDLFLKVGYGIFSTIDERSGYPFGSLVGYVPDQNGDCLIYISIIAEHWNNILHDSRASLLVANSWSSHPLSSARLTVLAKFAPCPEDQQSDLANRFGNKFKSVPQTIAGNFRFVRGSIQRLRWIGGFGQAGWIEQSNWRALFA